MTEKGTVDITIMIIDVVTTKEGAMIKVMTVNMIVVTTIAIAITAATAIAMTTTTDTFNVIAAAEPARLRSAAKQS
jgi:phage-related tail fiber protein